MLVTLNNFDWSITERDLVIFIPNWGRGNYIRRIIETMKTNIPLDKWIIIIGNDCQHEDLSGLKNQNVIYFTFSPNISRRQERGGSFIRNIAIKRSRSKWFFQKDPEVIIENDFIANILACSTEFYRLSGPACKVYENTSMEFMNHQATIEDCKMNSQKYPVVENDQMFFNMAFGVHTQLLQNIYGYDEDYGETYYYDTDLFFRLMANGVRTTMDPQCKPIHLWHPTPSFPDTSKTKAEYEAMGAMFRSKNPRQIVRNPNGWGEGGIEKEGVYW